MEQRQNQSSIRLPPKNPTTQERGSESRMMFMIGVASSGDNIVGDFRSSSDGGQVPSQIAKHSDISDIYEEQLSDLIADFVRTENLTLQAIQNKDRTHLLRASQQRLFIKSLNFVAEPLVSQDEVPEETVFRNHANLTLRKSLPGRPSTSSRSFK